MIELEGKYFYTYLDGNICDDNLKEQGYVEKVYPQYGFCFCKFFEWAMGNYIFSRLIQLKDLENAIIFDDEYSRDEWYSKHCDRQKNKWKKEKNEHEMS